MDRPSPGHAVKRMRMTFVLLLRPRPRWWSFFFIQDCTGLVDRTAAGVARDAAQEGETTTGASQQTDREKLDEEGFSSSTPLPTLSSENALSRSSAANSDARIAGLATDPHSQTQAQQQHLTPPRPSPSAPPKPSRNAAGADPSKNSGTLRAVTSTSPRTTGKISGPSASSMIGTSTGSSLFVDELEGEDQSQTTASTALQLTVYGETEAVAKCHEAAKPYSYRIVKGYRDIRFESLPNWQANFAVHNVPELFPVELQAAGVAVRLRNTFRNVPLPSDGAGPDAGNNYGTYSARLAYRIEKVVIVILFFASFYEFLRKKCDG
ncbi:unnamed protein product [Amoebophrya sp. A120]|nr:unnamed protein product [Amoebophrya sp. A120]|eukprot:GSA120T00022976001.1